MGFENLPPCEGDITIHVAVFRQHGGLYPMTAFAYWKIDDRKIVWTKGFVFLAGP
jgi:hypothetical protein